MSLYEILSDENVVESINNNLDYLVKCIPEIKYMMVLNINIHIII